MPEIADLTSRIPERVYDTGKMFPLFVYGTLRPGGTLYWHWIAAELRDRQEAVLAGARLHHVSSRRSPFHHPTFPVLTLDGSSTDLVVGDIMWMPGGGKIVNLMLMEMGAGYDLIVLRPTVGGMIVPSYGFTWPYGHGERISSGDWLTETKRCEAERAAAVREKARRRQAFHWKR